MNGDDYGLTDGDRRGLIASRGASLDMDFDASPTAPLAIDKRRDSRRAHEVGAVDEGRKPIETRGDFQLALRSAFGQAAQAGCPELILCDVDFANWPLGEIKVVEALTEWAYAHRKLTLMALDFGEITRRHARWVEWRRRWSHIVECRALRELAATQVPTVLLATDLVSVRLFDPVHYRGSVSSMQVDLVGSRELLDAVAQRSTHAFPATTLGL